MWFMHRIAIELTRRALTVRVELTPESDRPAVVVTRGETDSGAPGLAKCPPSNVVPFARTVAR